MVDSGDPTANCGGFYGQGKAIQWGHCCNSAVQHSQPSVRLELGPSFVVLHLERGPSSCTNGELILFILLSFYIAFIVKS